LGYASFAVERDQGAYLHRIGVIKTFQRKGVGRLLIQWLLDHFEQKLSLEVTSDNEKAIKFYYGIGLILTEEYTTKEGVEFFKFSSAASLA
jgi:ribosomal protein S18 acetylase RimI-like enzyme